MTTVVVILLWAAALYRLVVPRQGRTFVDGATVGAIIGVALAFTVKANEPAVDEATGPYVSDLIEHGTAAIAGALALLVLQGLRTTRPTTRQFLGHVVAAAAVLTIMTATFSVAPVHQQFMGDLDQQFGRSTAVDLYRLIFNLYMAYVLARCFQLSHRYAAQKGDAGRSSFLALTAYGYILALVYCITRVVYITLDRMFDVQPSSVRALGSGALMIGLALLSLGIITPKVVRAVTRLLFASRGTHRLQPLWRDLTIAFPLVVLPTDAPLTISRAELRYDRRLVEIAEGLAQVHILKKCPNRRLSKLTNQELAQTLHHSRSTWTQSAGVPAVQLLHVAATPADERQQLIAVADAYRRKSTVSIMACEPQPMAQP